MELGRRWRQWTAGTAEDALERRRETTLLTTLVVLIGLSLITQVLQLVRFAPEFELIDMGFWALNAAVALGAVALMRDVRRGRARRAATVLVGMLAVVAVLVMLSDGPRDPMFNALVMTCAGLAAILLGVRAGVLTVVAVAVVVLPAALLAGGVPLDTRDASVGRSLVETAGVLAVCVLVAVTLGAFARHRLAEPGAVTREPETLRPNRTLVLTTREAEIVRLVAQGLSNDGIAEALVVSPRTVQSHVANAMRKTGARNRTALGVLAVREGLVPLHEPVTAE